MSKRYKVTAPCVANVPVSSDPDARMTIFYKDALLPEGVPADRIKHLLDGNMIEELKGADAAQQEKAESEAEQGDGSRAARGRARTSQ